MEEISLKVSELYDLKTAILGLDIVSRTAEGKETRENVVLGFVNEAGLPEGVKRAAYRIGKQAEEQVELVTPQLQKLLDDPDRKVKEAEILNDTITLLIEKIYFSRIDHVSLKNNYQFLYDKVFK